MNISIKAFYCLWPNYKYIDKLVNSGIDTIIVTTHDLPFDKESCYYDSEQTVIETILRYRSRCQILLSPLWIRDPIYYDIPKDQQWTDQNGNKVKETPCPLNTNYIRSRVIPAISFAQEYKCNGIIWDLEHLGYHINPSQNIPFYSKFSPEYRCYCDECKKYNNEDLWKTHAGLIKTLLSTSGINIHGQFPYSSGWTMRQFPGTLLHFTENTYKEKVGFCELLKWKRSYKKYQVDPKIIPGIWCEYFREDKLIEYIKKLKKEFGGFWLYSHEYFGNKIPNPHMDYPYPGPASDWFFQELKKI